MLDGTIVFEERYYSVELIRLYKKSGDMSMILWFGGESGWVDRLRRDTFLRVRVGITAEFVHGQHRTCVFRICLIDYRKFRLVAQLSRNIGKTGMKVRSSFKLIGC